MTIALPDLPYPLDALAPHISEETLNYHYGKHHQGYVNKLNASIDGTMMADLSLEEIIQLEDKSTYNNAAQIWNHTFYWNSLSPNGGGEPEGAIADAIISAFGSVSEFRTLFTKNAASNFGSGWTWLIKNAEGGLEVINTGNAETPITKPDITPLLTVDVWEHAYYIDYRNDRGAYLESFWKLVNWHFAAANLEQ